LASELFTNDPLQEIVRNSNNDHKIQCRTPRQMDCKNIHFTQILWRCTIHVYETNKSTTLRLE